MNIIRSIIAGLLISVFIIVSTSFIISFVYEDEISEMFFRELNKRIKADVRTEKINLSLLKKFPGASVEFRDFQLNSLHEGDSVLKFSAEKIFLQFDVVELFTKNIDISHIDINKAKLFYRTDKSVEIRKEEIKNSNIVLNLNSFDISDLNYIILNNTKNFELKGFAEETHIDGNFSLSEKELRIDSENFIEYLKIKDFPYLKNKKTEYSAEIYSSPTTYKLTEGKLELENLPFQVSGSFKKNEKDINLNISGQNIRIPELRLYLPWQIRQKYKDLTIRSGELNLIAKVQGNIQNNFPGIDIDFKLSKGNIQVKKDKNLAIKNINLSGYFTNGKLNTPRSSYLIFEDLSANVENVLVEGGMELYNFQNPSIKTNGKISSDFKSLMKILNQPKIKKEKGRIESSFSLITYLNKPLSLSSLIQEKRLTGDATLYDVSFQYNEYKAENLDGFIYLDNSVLYIDQLSGFINETNQFTFKGKVEDINNHLSDSTHPINIEGDLRSELLNLSNLREKRDTSHSSPLKLPSSIKGNINLNINNLKWGNFFARKVQGQLHYLPGEINLESLKLQTLEGRAILSADLTQNPDQSFKLKSHSFLNHININETFRNFNNFGQTYVKAENLKGYLSGEIFFSSTLTPSFQIQTHTLNNVSDFNISNGELIQFKPMKSLSSFVDLEELKHIRFSTLSNKITIKNQVVNIPEMKINSSAIDLSVEGYHRFNGVYQYRVNMLLSEILSKKADKEVTRFGTIADDGVGKTRLFLIINGDQGKSDIKYDKDRVKEKIRTDIREEKDELKSILREEFGFFRKDTSLAIDTGESQQGFQIDWEEDEKKTKKDKPGKKKKKKTESEFIIKWE